MTFWDSFGRAMIAELPFWMAVYGLLVLAIRHHLRTPGKRSALIGLAAVVVFETARCAFHAAVPGVDANVTMPFVLVLFYLVLRGICTLPPRRRRFAFWSASAVAGFVVLIYDIVLLSLQAAGLSPDVLLIVGLVVCLGVPAALMPLFGGRMAWAFDEMSDEGLWKGLWVVPVMFLVVVCAVYELHWQGVIETAAALAFYAASGVFLVALMVVAYRALFDTMQKSVENERLRAEAQVAAFQTSRYASLRDRMRESSQARHDFRHKLVVLDALAERGDVEGLRAALAEYGELAGGAPERGTLCANFAVDAVAAHFLGRARAAGAEVRCELAALPEQLPVAESDVCMVLANLLENAVEAVERLDAGEEAGAGAGGSGSGGADTAPRIAVRAAVQGAALVLSVENTCVPGEDLPMSAVSAADGLPSSKRPGPGVGLTSAASLAAKHRGELRVGRQGPTFTAQAVLRG